MRTPEEIARMVQILTGIVRQTAEQTLDYVLELEVKAEQERIEQEERREQEMLSALAGNTKPKWVKPEGFGKDMHIEIMQGLILTYQQTGAPQDLIDTALARLEELQGKKK